jgi:hypothetical protein
MREMVAREAVDSQERLMELLKAHSTHCQPWGGTNEAGVVLLPVH